MTAFEYDDILIQYDDTISTFDGELPDNSKFYRVKKLGKVDSSGYMSVEIEAINRPIDVVSPQSFGDGLTPGTPVSVPAVTQTPFYYRISGVETVPGSGYKRLTLEKIDKPITYQG